MDAVGFLTCCFESVRHDVGEMTERVRSSTRFNHPFAPHRFSYVAFRNVQNNWTWWKLKNTFKYSWICKKVLIHLRSVELRKRWRRLIRTYNREAFIEVHNDSWNVTTFTQKHQAGFVKMKSSQSFKHSFNQEWFHGVETFKALKKKEKEKKGDSRYDL